jgi:hypothetical protein
VGREAGEVRGRALEAKLEGAGLLDGLDLDFLEHLVVVLAEGRPHVDDPEGGGMRQAGKCGEGELEFDGVSQGALRLFDDYIIDLDSRHANK